MTTTTPTRRPRPVVPPSQHARRRRVRPGRPVRPARQFRLPAWWSRRTAVVSTAALVALVVGLSWLVWFSPVLSVRTIEVAGADAATADVIRDLAAIPDGLPLSRVDTNGIEQALGALPQLESVAVERDWPSTVRIEVVPRVGLAVVEVEGATWVLDGSGVRFAQVTGRPAGLPLLQVEAAGPGDRATMAALEVLSSLPTDIRDRVTTVSAESPDSVVLILAGGRTVIWGSAADSERKALVLAGVFNRPARTIDVSSPSAVVLR